MSRRIKLFTDEPALGVRQGTERRHDDRRSHERGGVDRRHKRRRQARLRSALLSLATVAIPLPAKLTPSQPTHLPLARVTTQVTSFNPVDPRRAYDPLIREAALTYNVDPVLIRSVIQTESAFRPDAISRAGAVGLMQLMPEIAEAFEIADRFDPRQNIMGGTRLLRELLDQHRGNLPLVLAGYNAGAKAIARFGTVPPFPETRNYIARVTRLIREDQGSD